MRLLTTTTAAFGLLAMGGAITIVLPGQMTVDSASAFAPTPPSVIRFNGTTPDFDVAASSDPSHIADLVDNRIGSNGLPNSDGSGTSAAAPSSALRIQTNLPFETTTPQTYT